MEKHVYIFPVRHIERDTINVFIFNLFNDVIGNAGYIPSK
jgi:hypothetical protein